MEENTSTQKKSLNVLEIKKLLPHRYPMLMIDKVIDIEGDESATGIKNVTANEPFFEGHFPKNPIMPGVLIVEAMAQTAGALVVHFLRSENEKIVYFMSIEEAKFRRPVVPGDVLHLKVTKSRSRDKVWKYSSIAMVDGKVVAEAKFTAMISEA